MATRRSFALVAALVAVALVLWVAGSLSLASAAPAGACHPPAHPCQLPAIAACCGTPAAAVPDYSGEPWRQALNAAWAPCAGWAFAAPLPDFRQPVGRVVPRHGYRPTDILSFLSTFLI